LAKKIQPNMI